MKQGAVTDDTSALGGGGENEFDWAEQNGRERTAGVKVPILGSRTNNEGSAGYSWCRKMPSCSDAVTWPRRVISGLMAARTWRRRPFGALMLGRWHESRITCWIPTNRNFLQSEASTGRRVNQTFAPTNCMCSEYTRAQNSLDPTKRNIFKAARPGLTHWLTPSVRQHLCSSVYCGEHNTPMMAFFLKPSPVPTLFSHQAFPLTHVLARVPPGDRGETAPASLLNSNQMCSEQ